MSATEPSRRITPIWVPFSGSHAKAASPFMARSMLPVAGKMGKMTCSSVVMKSCTMLAKGASKRSERVRTPLASTVW